MNLTKKGLSDFKFFSIFIFTILALLNIFGIFLDVDNILYNLVGMELISKIPLDLVSRLEYSAIIFIILVSIGFIAILLDPPEKPENTDIPK